MFTLLVNLNAEWYSNCGTPIFPLYNHLEKLKKLPLPKTMLAIPQQHPRLQQPPVLSVFEQCTSVNSHRCTQFTFSATLLQTIYIHQGEFATQQTLDIQRE
jgi:hypothetical protein